MLNKTLNIFYTALFLLIVVSSGIHAKSGDGEIDVKPVPGNYLPTDLTLKDSHNNTVKLKNLLDKPTIIDFVYYRCKGICTPLMTDVADVINHVDLTPGKDYNLLSVSFDENETPAIAAKKKKTIMRLVGGGIADSAWRFCTTDSLNIYKLTHAAGFNFERTRGGFMHRGVLIFLSKEGKICYYLYPGFDKKGNFRILPLRFKMALEYAKNNNAVPAMEDQLKVCYSEKPKNESMVYDMFKISGASILLLVIGFAVYLKRKPSGSKQDTSV